MVAFSLRDGMFILVFMSFALFHHCLVWPCLLLMHSGEGASPLSQEKKKQVKEMNEICGLGLHKEWREN